MASRHPNELDPFGGGSDNTHDQEDLDPVERQRIESQRRLWAHFQNTATSLTHLYKLKVNNKQPETEQAQSSDSSSVQDDAWTAFQSAASSLSSMFRESVDVLNAMSDLAASSGQPHATRTPRKPTSPNRNMGTHNLSLDDLSVANSKTANHSGTVGQPHHHNIQLTSPGPGLFAQSQNAGSNIVLNQCQSQNPNCFSNHSHYHAIISPATITNTSSNSVVSLNSTTTNPTNTSASGNSARHKRTASQIDWPDMDSFHLFKKRKFQ